MSPWNYGNCLKPEGNCQTLTNDVLMRLGKSATSYCWLMWCELPLGGGGPK